jgi:hypothetical protein
MFRLKATTPLALLALGGVAACGSSGGGETTPPIAEAIAIALSASSLSVVQGQSNTANITLTRTGGYAGAVSLSLENAPTGVTGSFSPPSLTGTTATSTLLITAAPNAATATTNMVVRATGTGVTAQTATLPLTITAAPTGGYTLSLSQSTLTLLQGTSGDVTVNVNRAAPFAGAVSVAASGLPASVTMSPSPANITGANAQVTFAVGSGVAAGNYPITLRGTATGVPDQQVTLTLQVAAASGGTSVTVTFCQADSPIWVGSQSETGPWIRATATATNANAYTFNINNRGGFAAVFNASGGGYRSEITYGTATELAASGTQCTDPRGSKLVSGTVTSLLATDEGYVSLGGAEASRMGAGAFQLFDVGDGLLDLIAVRSAITTSSATPTKMIIRRGLNQAAGSTIPTLDFAAAEAFDPVAANITLGNLGSDSPFLLVYLSTANGGTGAYYIGGLFGGGATQPWYGLPDARLATGDLHNVIGFGVNQTGDAFRAVYAWSRQAVNRTLTLGPVISTPTITVAGTTPYVRHRVQVARQPEYSQAILPQYEQNSQSGGANYRSMSIQATAGYFGGNPTTWDIIVPDLSSASGFLATWGLQTSAATSYTIGAIGGPGDVTAQPSDGYILSIGFRSGNAASAEANPGLLAQRLSLRRAPLAWSWLRKH